MQTKDLEGVEAMSAGPAPEEYCPSSPGVSMRFRPSGTGQAHASAGWGEKQQGAPLMVQGSSAEAGLGSEGRRVFPLEEARMLALMCTCVDDDQKNPTLMSVSIASFLCSIARPIRLSSV